MLAEQYTITDRKSREKLVPVLMYVRGLRHAAAVSASLSFKSICHHDCRNRVRFHGVLSRADETRCLRLLDEIVGRYLKVDRVPALIQEEIIETAHKIIVGAPQDYLMVIKNRLRTISGDDRFQRYWDMLANPAWFEIAAGYDQGKLSVLQLKKHADFAALVIALAVLHCCGKWYYDRIAALEASLKAKYGGDFPFERLGLNLWPLDFSFAEEEEGGNEHHALLEAMRGVNADVKVEAGSGSLLWPRDVIAWLSDDRDTFTQSTAAAPGRYARGLPDEGGAIITGTAAGKFVVVAQGSLPDPMSEASFHDALGKRNIRAYTLSDGFLWTRDPTNGKEYALDSIHIDAVINFIAPADTIDGRPKLIIDPCYLRMVENSEGFKRLLREQSLSARDIIVVDEREKYLNLPNFSVVLDTGGNRKFLFNKDLGFTIPRLKLKPGMLVQPAVEITRMASLSGVIRCATNMLPESHVKGNDTATIAISGNLPSETRALLADVLGPGNRLVSDLVARFVSHVAIQAGPAEIPWEYDEFSQTAYVYLGGDILSDPEACRRRIKNQIPLLTAMLHRRYN